jgi:FMN-dependent NADH-azoreductase
MTTVLVLNSSASGPDSVSKQLVDATVERLRAQKSGLRVVERDLGADPVPHLTAETTPALRGAEAQTEAQRKAVAFSNVLIEELKAADIVVIGAPMYNFAVPTQLKAWIDRLAQAGRTFRYTETGPVGLAGGRKVIVASSRGGIYTAGLEALDHQEAYLRTILGFIGVTDIDFVRAEGLGYGPEHRDRAVAEAHQQAKASPGLAVAA